MRAPGRWLRDRLPRILLRWGAMSCAAVLGLVLVWQLASALFPFPHEKLERPYGQIVYDRNGDLIRMFLASDGHWRFRAQLDQITPQLVDAIVASEDQWFRYHPGVNPVSVLRAALSNLRAGGIVSGASTIPMQIARLMEPRPRNFQSKLLEALRALQMSRLYSKDELLEIYLNLTPYGGNIEGIRAASYFYFGKKPDRLSWAETALVTTLPRSPVSYDPTRNLELSTRARDRVIAQLRGKGIISPSQARTASSPRLPDHKQKQPLRAPHFAEMVRRQNPRSQELHTTLDLEIQRAAEFQIDSRKAQLRRQGIGNVAVVIIENETRKVVALVGSAGHSDSAYQGQVNGATARRSPGSALKPFLFALAYDRGLIVPDSPLLDVPYDYAGYVPKNYDRRYRGQVSASQALVQSLNVPAVHLLSRTGLQNFHQLLISGWSFQPGPSFTRVWPSSGAGRRRGSAPRSGQPVCLPGPRWGPSQSPCCGWPPRGGKASFLPRGCLLHYPLADPAAQTRLTSGLGPLSGHTSCCLKDRNLLWPSRCLGDWLLAGKHYRRLDWQL